MDIYTDIHEGNIRHKNRRKKQTGEEPMAIYIGQAYGPSMDI